MFPPEPLDIVSLEGGCSGGLDAFRFFLNYNISLELCMYGQTYSKSMDQPGKVASPARGQRNILMNYSSNSIYNADLCQNQLKVKKRQQ